VGTSRGRGTWVIAPLIGLLLAGCTTGGTTTAHTPSPSPSPSATAVPSPSPTPTPVPQQAEASLPLPRQEVAEGLLPGARDSLWVIGGFDPQRRSSATVQVYRQGGWVAGPAFPFPVDHVAATTSDGRLYVAGGYSNGVPRGDLYRINTTQDGWERLAPMHHPRGALVLLALGGILYAIGGAAGAEVAPVEAYDTSQGGWTDVGGLPLPRDHGAGFAWQGLACIAGGRSPNTARVDCYDPTSSVWSRLPDLPSPTSGAGAITLGGQAIVAGGENAGESTLVDHVFRFVGGSGWSDEPMLLPRHGIQLAVWGGRAWACGGATAAGYQATTACTSLA
jgi:Kelch motif